MEIHLLRVHKSNIKLLTNQKLEIEGNIDLLSEKKHVNIRVVSPKTGYSYYADIIYSESKQLLTIDSKTYKSGKPYITIEGQFSPQIRNYIIIQKFGSVEKISKFECFYERGIYGLVLNSSRFTIFVEGENKAKTFGKLGFFDKWKNYEHKGHYKVTNGVIFIDAVRHKPKKPIRKFDAVFGLSQISSVKLITPELNTQLIVNPLGVEKTVNFKWISSRYEQRSIIKIVPMEYFKFESLSECQVSPYGRFKIDAIYDVNNDSFISFSVPRVEWSTHKTKSLRPKVIFNMTFNGYNEIQEYDVKQNLHPVTNAFVILYEYFNSLIN
jgi:hypothetical protein